MLEGRGVDFFSVETFFELEELEAAIEAVRSVSSLPILAMLTFDAGAETLSGVTAREAVDRLAELGVAAAGANHGAGIQAALAALSEMGGNGLPLAAMPNIGLASMAGNRIIYPHASPEYFAEFAAHARSLGARVIGGCCGTTPTEIAAIASAVKEEREPSAPLVFAEREVVVAVPRSNGRRPSLRGPSAKASGCSRCRSTRRWAVATPECSTLPARSRNPARAASSTSTTTRPHGPPPARSCSRSRSSASSGVETIPHLTTRDATIMGLESQLLGAHACGIRNVLAVTGDPPEVGDYPGSRGVYEIDSIGLAQLMARLNRGEDYNGRAIDAATAFHIGVAVNPSADDLDRSSSASKARSRAAHSSR